MDLTSQVETLTNETTALRNEIEELKDLVTRQNETIINLLQEQNKLLIAKVNTSSADQTNRTPCFPIKTQDELDNFEAKITDDNLDGMVHIAKQLLMPGGLKKNVIKILADEIIMSYNVDGRHNKKRMQDYPKLLDLLYKATVKEGWTHKLFLDDLRRGFKFAKNRHFKNAWMVKQRTGANKSDYVKMPKVEEVLIPSYNSHFP